MSTITNQTNQTNQEILNSISTFQPEKDQPEKELIKEFIKSQRVPLIITMIMTIPLTLLGMLVGSLCYEVIKLVKRVLTNTVKIYDYLTDQLTNL